MRFATTWALFLLLLLPVAGQTLSPSSVGYPPYTTFENGSFDNVNMTNLNTSFSIPIVSYSGRGIPFSFKLVYNSLVMQPFGNTWFPRFAAVRGQNTTGLNYGWHLRLGTGLLTYSKDILPCGNANIIIPPGGSTTEWSNFMFTDANGTEHSFNTDYSPAVPATAVAAQPPVTPRMVAVISLTISPSFLQTEISSPPME